MNKAKKGKATTMKEFLKKHFSGPIRLVKDTRTLFGYWKKKKNVQKRNDSLHEKYAADLSRFHNIHKGERCFIVGTGPSLTLEDVELVKNEYTFGVNSCVTMYDRTDWRADYYGIVDSRAIDKFRQQLMTEEVKEFFYSDWDVMYDYPNGHAFPKDDSENMMAHNIWKGLFPKLVPDTRFSDDITKVVYTGKSVVYAMLQIAAYMGFSEIYLMGVDCNYAQPKMYSDTAAYADHKAKWSKAQLEQNGNEMLPQFEVAKRFAQEHGFTIYNATRGGQLETFERVALENLFETKSEQVFSQEG